MKKVLILSLAVIGFVLIVAFFVVRPPFGEPSPTRPLVVDSSQSRHTFSVRPKSKYGDPPLHEAIRDGELALVKKLVESGADLHHTDYHTLLPLHIAFVSYCGTSGEIFKYLLDAGADPNQVCSVHKMPIAHVIASGYHVDTFCDDIHSDENENLRKSLADDERNMLRLLHLHNANFGQSNSQGLTPLDCAIRDRCDRTAAIIRELISK